MIRIQPTNPNITDEHIYFAHNHGQATLKNRCGFDSVKQGTGGLIIFRSHYLKNTNTAIVEVIDLTGGNFISRPRVHKRNDGHTDSLLEEGYGKLVYPLDDSFNTSQILIIDGESVTVERDSQFYGNIDWVGKNTADAGELSNAPILTWKGPTGRTLPFDFNTYIEGYTTTDIKFSELSQEYYTCFGPNIYQGGNILVTLPDTWEVIENGKTVTISVDVAPKVTGAAITTYTDPKTNSTAEVLICTVTNHYAQTLGFVGELWVKYPSGWEIISSTVGGDRPTQCWFFNESGNRCTRENVEHVIDVNTKTVDKIVYDTGSGSVTLSLIDGEIKIKHDGEYLVYSDYKGDNRVTGSISVSDNVSRNFSTLYETTDETVPVYYLTSVFPYSCGDGVPPPPEGPYPPPCCSENPPPVPYPLSGPGDPDPNPPVIDPPEPKDCPMAISGPTAYTAGSYTVTGGCGTVTIVPPSSNCGTSQVVAYDSYGNTATLSVQMPIGVWVEVETQYATISGTANGLPGGTPCSHLSNSPSAGCYLGEARSCCYCIPCSSCPSDPDAVNSNSGGTSYYTCYPQYKTATSSLGSCSCSPSNGLIMSIVRRKWVCL